MMGGIKGSGFGVRFYRRMVSRPDRQAAANVSVTQAEVPTIEEKLRAAALEGDCHAIRILVMEGVDLESRDEQGRTALNIAMQYNRHDAMKTLMAARQMRYMAKIGDLPDTQFFRRFSCGRKEQKV